MQKAQLLWVKRGLLAALGLGIVSAIVLALMPQPVPVDVGAVARQDLSVAVDEEGKTRIRNIYVVAAPIAGKMLRSPLKVGDPVEKDQTVVAVLQPPAPSFRDVRTSLELETQVKACEANVALSEAELRQARAELKLAESEHERTRALTDKGVASKSAMDKAAAELAARTAAVARAEASVSARKRELDSAQVRRLGPEEPAVREAADAACLFDVKSPESGSVLKLIAESEQTLAIGAPLLEVGDPSDIEIVVELLSADAVKVKPGASAVIEGWGGAALKGRVRRIEPAGFTKISALGIEEQRVKTILDLVGEKSEWERLGHDFRVFVRIDVYDAENALAVPLGALFRRGSDWSVFVVEDGRAHARIVELGQRNSSAAEVLGGLKEGEKIILHPSDRVADGVAVAERAAEPR